MDITVNEIKKKLKKEYEWNNLNNKETKWLVDKIIQDVLYIVKEHYAYDFSKDCECKYRTGETWCCNQCGLPATIKNIKIE